MNKEDLKYAEELHYLHRFISRNQNLPFTITDLCPKTKNQQIDFIFETNGKKYGIELVRLWDRNKKISQRMPFIDSILDKARLKYAELGHRPLFINFSVNEDSFPISPRKDILENIYLDIINTVLPYQGLEQDIYVGEEDVQSKYILDMLIQPTNRSNDANYWLKSELYETITNHMSLLADTIQEKEDKYQRYIRNDGCREVYLLIITHTGKQQDRYVFDQKSLLNEKWRSNFDQIFLFDYYGKTYSLPLINKNISL